jgi:hypothetical protein
MRFCYTSYQEREHAHQMGIEQEQELSELTGRYYTILGRRHCRLGIKPLAEQEDYLDGYSHQYVKENIPF